MATTRQLELCTKAARQRRIAEIHFRFNGAGATEGGSCGAGFCQGHVFDPADFAIRTDGLCRLNPEMARMVVAVRP
jgi:hypothetical protein